MTTPLLKAAAPTNTLDLVTYVKSVWLSPNQSSREDILRSVDIPIQNTATVTAMHTNRQRLLNLFTALAAFLGCIAWINEFHSRPGAFCLEREDAEKAGPASVSDTTGQSAVLEHPVDVQVFRSNESVAGNELMRGLVVHVASRICDVFMQPSHFESNLLSSVASSFASGECSLFNAKFCMVTSHDLGVAERLSVAGGHERVQSNVDADFGVGCRDLVFGCFEDEADVPLSDFALDRCLFDLCVGGKLAVPANADCPNVLESQFAIHDLAAITISGHRENKRIKPICGLRSRVSWRRSCFASLKERLKVIFEFPQRLLRRPKVEISVEFVLFSLKFEPPRLIVIIPVDSGCLLAHLSSRQTFVVEPTMRFESLCQLFLLRSIRQQSKTICFNHGFQYFRYPI